MQNKNTNSSLTHEEIVQKLQELLRPSGWHNFLKGFLVSDDFKKIIQILQALVKDNKRFTPPLKQVFKAFQECPVDTLKVVMVGYEPYHQFGVADGMAFSSGNTMKPELALRYILKAVSETVYNSEKDFKELSPDLTSWANQGILLLNTSLTTEINKPGRHSLIWKSFTEYVFDMLNSKEEPLIWVFFGEKAQHFSELVDGEHYKFFVSEDPILVAEKKETVWQSYDIFNKINNVLTKLEKPVIKW